MLPLFCGMASRDSRPLNCLRACDTFRWVGRGVMTIEFSHISRSQIRTTLFGWRFFSQRMYGYIEWSNNVLTMMARPLEELTTIIGSWLAIGKGTLKLALFFLESSARKAIMDFAYCQVLVLVPTICKTYTPLLLEIKQNHPWENKIC